ncbi:hypothetical protein TWF102_000633 [Orbilia oligospora]|uniref:Uncharacterized protein n=1 Tax=Orbilia oligospora TaxID=2813651 RepID=A0A7C8NJI6_ORBOL|nr:hypothetical protein TWF102_000633 [Orbilia oligospora]KAF3099429.1 hypothetical protein TWF706_006529 [Orbilia oligospora]KAF3112363.1 hypothetical protein TWF103_003153 [Orbilia oligospora]KAF3120168.1 hypothetical protein TWF703_002716 [Orbilia oligospora]
MEESTLPPQSRDASKVSLINLPIEIKLMIIDILAKQYDGWFYSRETHDDLKGIAHSSRVFYQLCFRPRVFYATISLDPSLIELFKPGGLLEHHDGDIRSLQLNHVPLSYADENISDGHENSISWLRTGIQALPLFSTIRILYIAYGVPNVIERNAFFAILRVLAPLQALTILRFHVTVHYNRLYQTYQDIYSNLSSTNQQFLGEEIHPNEVEGHMAEHLPNFTFPKLESLHISLAGAGQYELDLPTPHPEQGRFYHKLLMATPRISTLEIKWIDIEPIPHDHEIPQNLDQKFTILDSIPPDTIFPHTNRLEIETSNSRISRDFEKIVTLFPNLKYLTIKLPTGTLLTNQWEFNSTLHQPIRKLKKLQYLILPWPRSLERGSYSMRGLTHMCHEWHKTDTPYLHSITFCGEKFPVSENYDMNIRLYIRYRRKPKNSDRWVPYLSGDTHYFDYCDFGSLNQCNYEDENYSSDSDIYYESDEYSDYSP